MNGKRFLKVAQKLQQNIVGLLFLLPHAHVSTFTQDMYMRLRRQVALPQAAFEGDGSIVLPDKEQNRALKTLQHLRTVRPGNHGFVVLYQCLRSEIFCSFHQCVYSMWVLVPELRCKQTWDAGF